MRWFQPRRNRGVSGQNEGTFLRRTGCPSSCKGCAVRSESWFTAFAVRVCTLSAHKVRREVCVSVTLARGCADLIRCRVQISADFK